MEVGGVNRRLNKVMWRKVGVDERRLDEVMVMEGRKLSEVI